MRHAEDTWLNASEYAIPLAAPHERKEVARRINADIGFLIFQRPFLRGTGLGGAVKG
jgi:hypothetical protein